MDLSLSLGLAIDANDNAWIANQGSDSVTEFLLQWHSSFGEQRIYQGGFNFPNAVMIDTTRRRLGAQLR